MNKKDNDNNKKIFYFFIGCVMLSLIIIGATFAYFVASTSNSNTVNGGTYTSSFSLSVTRVTTVDMAYGLIPMKNKEAPHAAEQMCRDDNQNAGCQIYKITVSADSAETMFVDGYIVLTNREGIETRFTRVYPEQITDTTNNEEKTIFKANYTKEDFNDPNFDEDEVIKDGQFINNDKPVENLNHTENSNCLLAKNEQIGGNKPSIDIYVMIWVYDNGNNQDYLQGMELAYNGLVVFNTAEGNEIKATFD
ncbi:MAG: hypothetical protein IKF19_05780 [Bacilli bacterium]|nr:hypothetical protein [Bacilli bacterium]